MEVQVDIWKATWPPGTFTNCPHLLLSLWAIGVPLVRGLIPTALVSAVDLLPLRHLLANLPGEGLPEQDVPLSVDVGLRGRDFYIMEVHHVLEDVLDHLLAYLHVHLFLQRLRHSRCVDQLCLLLIFVYVLGMLYRTALRR